jgi:hypothetical protein
MKQATVRLAATVFATTALLVGATSVGAAPANAKPPWGAKSYGPSLTAFASHSHSGDTGPTKRGPAGRPAAPGSAAHAFKMIMPGAMAESDRVPPPGAVAADNREPDAWVPASDEPAMPTPTNKPATTAGGTADRSHNKATLTSTGTQPASTEQTTAHQQNAAQALRSLPHLIKLTTITPGSPVRDLSGACATSVSPLGSQGSLSCR